MKTIPSSALFLGLLMVTAMGTWYNLNAMLQSHILVPTPSCSPHTTATGLLPPCRIAVTNRRPYHFEILESISSQFPMAYMPINISSSSCNSQQLYFDYYAVDHETRVGLPNRKRRVPIKQRNTLPQRFLHRCNSFQEYFNSFLRHRRARPDPFRPSSTSTTKNHIMDAERFFGTFSKLETDELDPKETLFDNAYDVVIEASCFCEQNSMYWLLADPRRVCIFHYRCDPLAYHERAVWLNPHHSPRFFLPTLLPELEDPKRQAHHHKEQRRRRQRHGNASSRTPHKLCVVGDFERRALRLLEDYLASDHGRQSLATSRFQVELIGGAHEPKSFIQDRTTFVHHIFPIGFVDFYREVLTCDGILALISPNVPETRDYFNRTGSRLMLSGTFSTLIEYKIPFVMHHELFDLYQKYLPQNSTYRLHDDDSESFIQALGDFLDDLDRARDRAHDTE